MCASKNSQQARKRDGSSAVPSGHSVPSVCLFVLAIARLCPWVQPLRSCRSRPTGSGRQHAFPSLTSQIQLGAREPTLGSVGACAWKRSLKEPSRCRRPMRKHRRQEGQCRRPSSSGVRATPRFRFTRPCDRKKAITDHPSCRATLLGSQRSRPWGSSLLRGGRRWQRGAQRVQCRWLLPRRRARCR